MSWLSDSTPLVAGGWLSSAYAGHGVRGADVPSTGEHGAAIIYPGLSLPAEADDEFRLLILTWPGTLPGLVIREDSSIEVPEDSPAGVHTGTMRGYKNGVIYGTDPQTFTITIGPSEIAGDATLDEPTAGGGFASTADVSGDAQTDEPTAGGGLEGPATIGGDATIDEPSAGGALEGAAQVSGDAVTDEPTAGGGFASLPNSSISGDAVVDEPSAGGGAESAAEVGGDASADGPSAGGGAESAAEISGDAVEEGPTAAGGAESDVGPGAILGDAVIDEPTAAGGLEAAAEVHGDAVTDEPTAGGGLRSSATGQLTEELLTAVLRTVCQRVSPDVAPLDTQRPYITYQVIGGQSWRYIDLRPADNRHAMVQINVWADTRRQARDLIQSVEEALCSTTTLLAWPMAEAQSDSTELNDRTVYGSLQDFEVVTSR